MDLNRLEKTYNSEEKCRELFSKLLWPSGPVCPHCQSARSWPIRTRSIRECQDCGKQFSLTTKTIFHGTKLGFRVWLKALYFVLYSSKGVSSVYLSKWIGVSQKSAWKMIHAIRAAMEMHQIQSLPLSGIVELDEKYIGGKPRHGSPRKAKRGRATGKDLVFLAIEREGKSQALHIDNLDEIPSLTKTHIEPNSRIMSDKGSWYQSCSKHFVSHETVCHGRKEYSRGEVYNNTAESFASMLERAKQGVYHFISSQHLHHYLAEVVFRWNHKTYEKRTIKRGKNAGRIRRVVRVIPFIQQLKSLAHEVRTTQLRRAPNGGLRHFPEQLLPVFGL